MAAGDLKVVYGTPFDLTITLASLAFDASLLTGRESSVIDNTTDLWTDFLISGKIKAGTSPTASRQIEVWGVGSWDGTLWPDVFDGTDSAETVTAQDIKNSICRAGAIMGTSNTTGRDYPFQFWASSMFFGFTIPPKFSLFVTHSTGVNLDSTAGNHQIRIQPIRYNVAP